MARVIPIQCPQCGGGLKVKPTDEIVQCQYCQTSSFIRKAGMTQPPVLPPGMPSPTTYVDLPDPPATGGGTAIAWIVVAAGLFATIAAAVAKLTAKDSRTGESAVSDEASAWDPGVSSKVAGSPTPKLVDAADVIEAAVAEARKSYPDATFVGANFHDVRGGMIDINAQNAGSARFAYRRVDASKPAGKDVEAGSFHIMVKEGQYSVWALHTGHGATLQDSGLALPKCRGAAAWKTAVESGVPADAHAKLHLDVAMSSRGTDAKAGEWSFRVDGHDDYRREIDAQTCALRRSWAPQGSRAAPVVPRASQPKPTAPPPRPVPDRLGL
ncbi:MAG: hypothetical protein FJ096_09840 [Deltaproteobacteria bacterium]|nr:hypothetical protein [Deltaproteobacteria bacterium]